MRFQDLLGDYSGVANLNTVMQQKFGDAMAQYQLAELTGVRFVGMSETRGGVELEDAVVKQITGGNTIAARSPYGRPFTYRPQFTIWMSTNHKPEIPDGSEAIWDRMRLIPFNQRFEGKKADADLPQKLREELAGVLAWAVRGCVEWHRDGLGSSAAVEAATAAYRAETDVYERFFSDVCVFGPKVRVGKTQLFREWQKWCDAEGEDPGKQVQFSRDTDGLFVWPAERGQNCIRQNSKIGARTHFEAPSLNKPTVSSRDMKEKGVVKNFEEKKIRGEWFWRGVGVLEEGGGEKFTEEVDISPSPSKSASEAVENAAGENLPPSQKSCKQRGGESPGGKVSEDSQNFSGNRTRVGNSSEIDQNLPPEPKPSPHAVTGPLSWEEDGMEIEYMPEGE